MVSGPGVSFGGNHHRLLNYFIPILGEPVLKVDAGTSHPGAILTEKGYIACDPQALDTAWAMLDQQDPTERCELKRGHIHIRVKVSDKWIMPNPYFGLELKSGWLFILPFKDLPADSRAIVIAALPAGFTIPVTPPAYLKQVADAYESEKARTQKLRQAVAAAGFPSPVTLHPTGHPRAPLRVYGKTDIRHLPLPTGPILDAILASWTGEREAVDFQPVGPPDAR